MKMSPLGRTGLDVSRVCLGTMTFGEQNTEAEGHRQMDMALDRGINFFDTAEMYSIPPREETYGSTEGIIGNWFKARGNRDKVVLASKILGPGFDYVRGGDARHNKANIQAAVDASLQRLQTDYIDLYQIHWPERKTNYFGQLGYTHKEGDFTPLDEVLEGLDAVIKAGKVRHVGVSNETPWGVMRFVMESESKGLPRMASIQNPYSLLNRSFEVGLAEVAIREDVGLLAYSPLAFGALSGKYLGGKQPEGARLTLFPTYGRYTKPNGVKATEAYAKLAAEHGLSLDQMSLKYIDLKPFVTSTIIGATTEEQLTRNIDAFDLELSEEVLEGIEAIHTEIPNPAP
ncbi:MAG: NADP(H)-dependent aldo-keto reductase [Magnetovibrionaceae bacterium]